MAKLVDLAVYRAAKDLNFEFSRDGSPILRPEKWGFFDHIENNSDLVEKVAEFHEVFTNVARSWLYVADEHLMCDYKLVKVGFDSALSKVFKNIDPRTFPLAKDVVDVRVMNYIDSLRKSDNLEQFVSNYARLVQHETNLVRDEFFKMIGQLYDFNDEGVVFAFGVGKNYASEIAHKPNVALTLMSCNDTANSNVENYSFKLESLKSLDVYLCR